MSTETDGPGRFIEHQPRIRDLEDLVLSIVDAMRAHERGEPLMFRVQELKKAADAIKKSQSERDRFWRAP